MILAVQVFTPKGKEGEVEVTVKVAGYNQKVLDAAQIKDAVSTHIAATYVLTSLRNLKNSKVLVLKQSIQF